MHIVLNHSFGGYSYSKQARDYFLQIKPPDTTNQDFFVAGHDLPEDKDDLYRGFFEGFDEAFYGHWNISERTNPVLIDLLLNPGRSFVVSGKACELAVYYVPDELEPVIEIEEYDGSESLRFNVHTLPHLTLLNIHQEYADNEAKKKEAMLTFCETYVKKVQEEYYLRCIDRVRVIYVEDEKEKKRLSSPQNQPSV